MLFSLLWPIMTVVVQGGGPAPAPHKSILWAPCGDSKSLAASSSWLKKKAHPGQANLFQLQLASSGENGGSCLTHPGPEVPGGWGPHLVAAPCNATSPEQRWTFLQDTMLQYAGAQEVDTAAKKVCIQVDGGAPWRDSPPAATWPCSAQPAWNEAVKELPGPAGAVKLQIDMHGSVVCLDYAAKAPPAPPPPPPAPPAPLPRCANNTTPPECYADSRCIWSSRIGCSLILAQPTAQQLAWQDFELGALFQYNIGEYGELINSYACGNTKAPMPPASMFDAPQLSVAQWMDAVVAYGGKYAVLTVQAGCGFDLWPSNVTLRGHKYNYTITESKYQRDLLREFVNEARAKGIQPGIYYIVNHNTYLTRLSPPATVAETEAVILGQLEEIWTGYGELVELWFDGGTVDKSLAPKITALLQRLQPHAVCFQGPTATQGLRWAGSESGHAALPNWSAAKSSVDFGGGAVDGAEFAPTEADVTLSSSGAWYWRPGQPIKSLAYLTELYDASVGHNANLLLNFAPEYSGLLPSESVARFKEFGAWISGCYGSANRLNDTAAVGPPYPQDGLDLPVGQALVLSLPAARWTASQTTGLRVVLMEDQGLGQRITNYSVEGLWLPSVPNTAAADARTSRTAAAAAGWQLLELAQSVGHKRIIEVCPAAAASFAGCPTTARLSALRFTVHAVAGAIPSASMRSVAVYGGEACALPSAPPHAPCELLQDYAFAGARLPALPKQGLSVAECCAACRAVKAKGCVGFKLEGQLEGGVQQSSGSVCRLFKALGGGQKVSGDVSGSPIWG